MRGGLRWRWRGLLLPPLGRKEALFYVPEAILPLPGSEGGEA